MSDFEHGYTTPQPNLNNTAYLDFESSMCGKLYLAGVEIGGKFEQIVLTPGLEGLARHHSLQVMDPAEFAHNFLTTCGEKGYRVAAYSEAEKSVLEKLAPGSGAKYLNIRTSARKWINKYRKADFEELPPLAQNSRMTKPKRRQLKNSLFSVSRLLSDEEIDGIDRPSCSAYGYDKTSQRFKVVINALGLRENDYSRLTPVQKGKGTKALNHNRFDVRVLPRLHAVIETRESRLISAGIGTIE